ncbi:hypothetical protein [Cupriavidus sp. YR651]|uniref:hypothetical protein n=1 Tax=Cupriavidus sp. YR651 TaxID=1855315 RepID=UPI0015A1A005|nr:hypothetical protein [Cupriavidus sp. YR651]
MLQQVSSDRLRQNFGRENTLFRLAAQLEAACPWRDLRPPVWAGSIINEMAKQ